MRKILILFLFIINIVTFSEISINLSDNSKDSSMAIYNNYSYIAFNNNNSVYFSKGLLNGTNFSTVKINTATMNTLGKPDICVNTNGDIYVFWTGKTTLDTYSKIYYSKSVDSGNSFSIPLKLEPVGTNDWNFSEVKVSCSSNRIGVASIGSNSTGTDIRVFYGNSIFSGLTGNVLKNITTNAAVWKTDYLENISGLNLVTTTNGNFNVLFEREYNDTIDIFFKSYVDTAIPTDIVLVSQTSQNVSGQLVFKSLPNLLSDGNNVYFVYQDISTGINRLKVMKSSDYSTWESLLFKGFSTGVKSTWPILFKVDNSIYCLWDEGSEAVYMKYKKIDFISQNQSEYSIVFESESPEDLSKSDFLGGSDRFYYVYSSNSGSKKTYFGQQYIQQDSGGTGPTSIISKNPDSNAINVSPSGGVRIEFSNAVNPVVNAMISFRDEIGALTFSVSNISDRVCVVTPSAWKKNTVYTISISGVTDKSGNSIPPAEWQFTTSNQDSTISAISKLINYPNPYKGGAFTFAYDFSQPADSVKIQVFNMKGKLIRSIRSSDLQGAGSEVIWDVTDKWGNNLANGVYVYKIIAVINGKTVEKNGKFVVAI
ncbi:MAG: Ig-like domain-containing protein [Candidatus Muirbacterium halophilum]|nr:Ig-like domain-containing protein [Candidatus Muirbacterium halophilum]